MVVAIAGFACGGGASSEGCPKGTDVSTVPTPEGYVRGPAMYVDPSFGYSFMVPEDYFAVGSSVSSYDPLTVGGPCLRDDLKVDFSVHISTESVDDWVAGHNEPKKLQSSEHFHLGDIEGIKLRSDVLEPGLTITNYFFKDDDYIYEIDVYWSESQRFSVVEDIIKSFEFPS
jgi:hypothetical protein